MSVELVIRGRRVVTKNEIGPASVHVRRGYISSISIFDDVPSGCDLIEAGEGSVVMPGLVDTHVHVNEPGRTDWEGFASATRSAAAGGTTTLIEMPLNCIPATTSVAAFQTKLSAADGQLSVDTGFWGGVVPGNTQELRGLWDAGCFGFKCFLIDSGVREFASVSETDLRAALPVLAKIGAPLLAHAELPEPIEEAAKRPAAGASPKSYQTWLDSRPRAAENDAIELLLRLGNEFGARTHIVHLSSTDALPQIRRAKATGLALSVETCPHYLIFSCEEILDGATQLKCAPPIRERENRES